MRRVVASCAATVLAASVAACSGASHSGAASDSTSISSASNDTRWWSNSATSAGSRVDTSKPDAVAAKLHPSRTDYCGMLRQTVAAGKAVFGGASADPAWVHTLTAFVQELQRVAPQQVSADWQLLGDSMLTLVRNAGKTPAPHPAAAPAAIEQAAAHVAADAKTTCNVDLAASAG